MTSEALRLYGTDEPLPERRLLRAGRLSAILEEGNLRAISFDGVEAVRAVNYLARDSSWGTYKAEISDLSVAEQADSFTVGYDALCAGPEGRFAYRMNIRGEGDGRLTLTAEGTALTDFPTNRTGFVVLHPAEAAGGRLEIRHGDGTVEQTVFPKLISPDQPAFDIAVLIHEPAPGLTSTVEMQGDAFEMEDQRNWSDASFKTYIRALSKPRPYVISEGAKDVQRIEIRLERMSAATRRAGHSDTVSLQIGGPVGVMPRIALFLDDEAPVPRDRESLGSDTAHLSAQDLIVRVDGSDPKSADRLGAAANFAAQIGAELAVEGIFDCRDVGREAHAFAAMLEKSEVLPSTVLVSPRRELKTRPSGTLPGGEQPVDRIVSALRAAGLKAPIGAGTPSFFTEFNRNPPGSEADFVFFSIAGNVHAADDISVMETLGAYPAVIESARAHCPGMPIWLGPCTIGMRHNPYGAAVADNPHRVRKPAVRDDPRHGAQFGAAFMAGAAAAAAGVDRLILGAPAGAFGLLDADCQSRPGNFVHTFLAESSGAARLAVACSGSAIAALCCESRQGRTLLLANLSAEPVTVTVPAPFQRIRQGIQGNETALPADGRLVVPAYGIVLLTA